jgi:IS30 family transposase
MDRSPSTLSREIGRNDTDYRPSRAQASYQTRRKASVRKSVFEDKDLRRRVQYCLSHCLWSPEQIEHRLRLEGRPTVSFKTIYLALEDGRLRDTLRYYLRRKYRRNGKARKPMRRCFAQGIELRPASANERREPGHWEGDTVYLPREQRYLVTLVDRHSRYLHAGVVGSLETSVVCDMVCRLLDSSSGVRSITLDRGMEFAGMSDTRYADRVYFANPGAPWERGTVENTNGLLRQFLPKGKAQSEFSTADLPIISALLNRRPRACLNWLSPFEFASSLLLHFT